MKEPPVKSKIESYNVKAEKHAEEYCLHSINCTHLFSLLALLDITTGTSETFEIIIDERPEP